MLTVLALLPAGTARQADAATSSAVETTAAASHKVLRQACRVIPGPVDLRLYLEAWQRGGG